MSPTKINAVEGISRLQTSTRLSESEHDSVSIVSLEDRFKESIANQAVTDQFTREKIFSALNNQNVTSDPTQLAYWQKQLSIYTLDTNLCSTLARKAVSTIETLVKT